MSTVEQAYSTDLRLHALLFVGLVLACRGPTNDTGGEDSEACEVGSADTGEGSVMIGIAFDTSDPEAREARPLLEGDSHHFLLQHWSWLPDDCLADPNSDTLLSTMVNSTWSDRISVPSGWTCASSYASSNAPADPENCDLYCSAESEPTWVCRGKESSIELVIDCYQRCENDGD